PASIRPDDHEMLRAQACEVADQRLEIRHGGGNLDLRASIVVRALALVDVVVSPVYEIERIRIRGRMARVEGVELVEEARGSQQRIRIHVAMARQRPAHGIIDKLASTEPERPGEILDGHRAVRMPALKIWRRSGFGALKLQPAAVVGVTVAER